MVGYYILIVLTYIIFALGGNNYMLALVPLILTLPLIVRYFYSKNLTTLKTVTADFPLVCFFLLLCVGMLRTSLPGVTDIYKYIRVLNFLFFVLSIYIILIKYTFEKYDIQAVFTYIILTPFGLWALINIILWLVGVKAETSAIAKSKELGDAIFLKKLGYNISRVEFALSGGFNNYAATIGSAFLVSVMHFVTTKGKKVFILILSFLFFISLLFIDSRSSLIYPVLIVIAVLLTKNISIKWYYKLIPFVMIAGPFFFLYALPLLSDATFLNQISRSSHDITTGNSRFLIWEICQREFSDFKFEHLVGYGEFGHFGSGVSQKWAAMFSEWENPELKTPHNTLFSILFDYGYLGLTLYIVVLFRSIKRIISSWDMRKSSCLIYLAFYCYYVIGGITEVFSGFYCANFVYIFIIILITEKTEYLRLKPAIDYNNNL